MSPPSAGPKSTASALRRRVTWRQLELLAAFERAPNLSAAADAVYLTQPAASKLLATLSADVGVQLFERSGRSLSPTAAGRALITRAAALLGNLDRVQAELEAIRDGLAGSVTVGAGVGASYALVPQTLALLMEQTPGIAVRVRDGPMDELVPMLRDGRIDMLVGRIAPPLIGHDEAVEKLYDPPMQIVCRPEHPLATQASVGWPALLAQEWILPEDGTPMRTAVEGLFQTANGRPARVQVQSSSIPMNVALLGTRDLVWPLSADIAATFTRLGLLKVLPVDSLPPSGALVVVYTRERVLLPAAARLIDCFRVIAARLALEFN